VSVRVDEKVLKELEREGVNPSQVSRKAIEAEATRIRTQRVLGELKKKAVRSRESAADIIRRLRDES
jgi:post-segregation antitoxin (ccd killing protein)